MQAIHGIRVLGLGLFTAFSVLAAAADTVYYVRTGGDDTWDGLSDTHLGGLNGPKATVMNAVATINTAGPGYHTLDIGEGTFVSANALLTRTMRIVGKGPGGLGGTLLERSSNPSDYYFTVGGVTNASAVEPLLLSNFKFTNSTVHAANILTGFEGYPNHLRFEDVSVDDMRGLDGSGGIRPNINHLANPALLDSMGNTDWTFKHFTARNIPPGTGGWLLLRNATGARGRHSGWVFDGVDISDNASVYGSLTDNRWISAGFTLTNAIWSRNANNGAFALNNSSVSNFVGRNVIYGSTIEDNNTYGIWANRMGEGADLVILNSTLRDTGSGLDQCTHVFVTIPTNITIGQIRVEETVFDSLGACIASHGLYIQDDGAIQTSPIVLKDVDFNACATGLMITGAVAALWYVDPNQSGASINGGGTLVSGGRQTGYGDANLDGVVDALDAAAAGGQPYTYREGAIWADGDFNFDGVFDELDWIWLPDGGTTTSSTTTTTSSSSSTDTSSTSSTSSTSTSTTSTTSTTAVGMIYYVRVDGFDTADGLTPTGDSSNGPMQSVVHAYTTASHGDTVDIGPGVFELAQSGQNGLVLTNRVHLLGAGASVTRLTSTNATLGILHIFGSSGGTNADSRTVIQGLTLDPVFEVNYGIVFEENVENLHFEDIAFFPTEFAWRMRSAQPPGYWMSNISLKNFDLTGGKFWLKTSSENAMPFQVRNWAFDGGRWTNISWNTFYRTPSLAIDGLTVTGGFVFQNNSFAFLDTSPHIANLVYDGVGGVSGAIRLESATFIDNREAGVDLRNLYSGASVVISNCTLVETGDWYDQHVGLVASVEPAVTLGAIRAIGGTWSNLQAAIVIEDNGGQQDSPIELKDIHFGNCATGLVISGWAANLWYVCPDLSGATIDPGGVLVSGGRQTCYGDINLDGEVDMLDSVLARQYYPMASNATWTTGDFDFDGDFDEHDLAWLPPFTGSMLIVR